MLKHINIARATFDEFLVIVFSLKVNLLCLLCLTELKSVLSSTSYKSKNFAKDFSVNSNLDDSGISLPTFPSRDSLKLHNIHVTPKMVAKVITSLDLSKTFVSVCIPVLVLMKREPELSYKLAELFNMCLKESCFQDCWKLSFVIPVLREAFG